MEKITREEALRRWSSAKAQKKELVEKMRKMLYEDYKARTGEEPLTFNVLWWRSYHWVLRTTVLAIVEEFFSKNEAALLYICETGDGMQKMRNRLFHFWFGVYSESDEYLFLPQVVYDEEDNENYAALIIRRDNPKFNDLVTEFTNTIIMLNSKPDTNNNYML